MADDPTPTPVADSLTQRALQRLRRVAKGNGLAPEAIELIESDEKTYTLSGILTLIPTFEQQSVRYPGPVRGSNRKVMESYAAIREEAADRQKQFKEKNDWIADSRIELNQAEGLGWGLDGAKITFPDKLGVLAACETCQSCQGRRLITCAPCQGNGWNVCPQCAGQRQEPCYGCGGRGENPAHPGQVCAICNGTRFALCRMCRGTGQVQCPVCQGRGGTPCPACQGSGQITEEIALGGTVTTQFKLVVQGLPGGLRRGLDRLGVANLAKGHADIRMIDIAATMPDHNPVVERMHPEAELWSRMPDEQALVAQQVEDKKKAGPEIHYEAVMPYADIRVRFGGGRISLIAAFGKHGALLDVPAFLDMPLEPARKALTLAANGKTKLDAALKARAMRDALGLVLAAKATVKDLRRLYPFGISPPLMQEMLAQMQLALNRMTVTARSVVAIIAALVSAGLFGLIYLTAPYYTATARLPVAVKGLADAAILIAALFGCWGTLTITTRLMLQRHFKDYKISFSQKNGKTGYGMLAAVLVAFALVRLWIGH